MSAASEGGRLNGYGLLIAKSGVAYVGTFKDNIAQSDLTQKECPREVSTDWTNCIGTHRFPDGNVYRGEFAHGLPEGFGMLEVNAVGSPEATQARLPLPGVYVGAFGHAIHAAGSALANRSINTNAASAAYPRGITFRAALDN